MRENRGNSYDPMYRSGYDASQAFIDGCSPCVGRTKCCECGFEDDCFTWPIINTSYHHEAVEALFDGSLFEYTCPICGYFDLLTYQCFYYDAENNYAVLFKRPPAERDESLRMLERLSRRVPYIDGVPNPPVVRWVTHVDDLSEKARIACDGLDDRAVEIAKYMVVQWLSGTDELYRSSWPFYECLEENGDLSIFVNAIVDEDSRYIDFFADKYEEIEEELEDFDGCRQPFVVSKGWAKRYLSNRLLDEADDAY